MYLYEVNKMFKNVPYSLDGNEPGTNRRLLDSKRYLLNISNKLLVSLTKLNYKTDYKIELQYQLYGNWCKTN